MNETISGHNSYDPGRTYQHFCAIEQNKLNMYVFSFNAMLNAKMIGNKIAEARKKLNISQAQLAEQLFISSQAVGKWERGESLPDIIMLNRLAEILNVGLNYFSENPPVAYAETLADATFEEKGKSDKKPSWDMSQGNWVDADFSGLKNLNEKFRGSNMQRCLFIGSDMSGLHLKGNHVDNCDFSDSSFNGSHIQGSHMVKNQFGNCSLMETQFTGCHIHNCDFTGADFTDVTMKSCDFSKNTIIDAVWKRTSFIGMQLSDIVFKGRIEDCSFELCSYRKATFENATLVNTFFKNGNLKKIRFVDCKADRMTYEFLKNGKANLTGITLLAPDEET